VHVLGAFGKRLQQICRACQAHSRLLGTTGSATPGSFKPPHSTECDRMAKADRLADLESRFPVAYLSRDDAIGLAREGRGKRRDQPRSRDRRSIRLGR
jgi:hypothetical protein